jgi:hypothetical protein
MTEGIVRPDETSHAERRRSLLGPPAEEQEFISLGRRCDQHTGPFSLTSGTAPATARHQG